MNIEGYKKHRELIEAWANGAVIELYRKSEKRWVVPDFYIWSANVEHRIKPFEPEVGEMILVSDTGSAWEEAMFATKIKDSYYCCVINEGKLSVSWDDTIDKPKVNLLKWKYAKPVNQ